MLMVAEQSALPRQPPGKHRWVDPPVQQCPGLLPHVFAHPAKGQMPVQPERDETVKIALHLPVGARKLRQQDAQGVGQRAAGFQKIIRISHDLRPFILAQILPAARPQPHPTHRQQ